MGTRRTLIQAGESNLQMVMVKVKVNVNESRYRPRGAQRVPGG